MSKVAEDQKQLDALRATTSDIDEAERLVLNLEGFEGPLDLLLTLARAQKVDLSQIAILPLVEQYLAFVSEARRLRLELAADYLVMAAWLAYLKSRLLVPDDTVGDEPSADELAARLQLQLQRLESMREAGASLMSRDRMGRDMFRRGAPEGVKTHRKSAYDVTLYELLKSYAEQRVRTNVTELRIIRRPIFSLEEALHRLERLVGDVFNWTQLMEFLPQGLDDNNYKKSAIASMFVASLELAREGELEIRQLETYGPLYLRKKEPEDIEGKSE